MSDERHNDETNDTPSAFDIGKAPAFRFDSEGDYIIGRVVDYREGFDNKFSHDHYPIVVFAVEESEPPTDDEAVSLHLFHTALLSQFHNANPDVGERVRVQRLEDRLNVAGTQTYRDFAVSVDRAQSERRSFSDRFQRLD